MELVRRNLNRRGARSIHADVRGHRMHYFDVPGRGCAPTILLLHGLGGSATGWSRCLLPLSRKARRVVAVDMPGSGFSPLPRGGPLSLLALADQFEAFCAQEVPEPIVLVGNSLGGALTVRYSAKNPRSIAATVLVAPGGAPVSEPRFQELLTLFRVGNVADARALSRRLFHKTPVLVPLLFGHDLFDLFTRPSVRQVLAEADQRHALRPDELRALAAPTLLLWGRSERVLPYEMVHFFRTHLPAHAEIHEVDGFGHCPQLERPEELVARIQAFLQRRVV
jgi:pimeloyl-ACP methyl ester carboxylesterase